MLFERSPICDLAASKAHEPASLPSRSACSAGAAASVDRGDVMPSSLKAMNLLEIELRSQDAQGQRG
jgi:hypothetical protein